MSRPFVPVHKSARCHNRIFVLRKLPSPFRSAAGSASGIALSPLYKSRFYKYLQCARTYAMYLYNTSARCEGNHDHDGIVDTVLLPNEGGQAYDWPLTPSKSFVSPYQTLTLGSRYTSPIPNATLAQPNITTSSS